MRGYGSDSVTEAAMRVYVRISLSFARTYIKSRTTAFRWSLDRSAASRVARYRGLSRVDLPYFIPGHVSPLWLLLEAGSIFHGP